MNTVQKGDTFELASYNLIKDAIENDKFGISPKHAVVFQKKGYFSSVRKNNIIFDLSIEVWPPNSTRYSLLYLIECKGYSTKNVPVGDVENFLYKIREINHSQGNDARGAKGVFISNSSFQGGGIEIAKETGLMLIEIDSSNELSIKLHRTERNSDGFKVSEADREFETFLLSLFDLNNVQGLKKLSKSDIERETIALIKIVDEKVLEKAMKVPLDKICEFLNNQYGLKFDFNSEITNSSDRIIAGYFDVADNMIKVNRSLKSTDRFSFVLAHEIGHFLLHRELKINQKAYENFRDSEYDFASDKYLLNNHKNWIEWQANEFASNLIMPNVSIYNQLINKQRSLGISKVGYIHLDDQPVNRKDFGDITNYLSRFFDTTFTSVMFKLESLGLITYDRKRDAYEHELRSSIFELHTDF